MLFFRKYRNNETDIDNSVQEVTTDQILADSKNHVILNAVKETHSFDELSKVLSEQPDGTFIKQLNSEVSIFSNFTSNNPKK